MASLIWAKVWSSGPFIRMVQEVGLATSSTNVNLSSPSTCSYTRPAWPRQSGLSSSTEFTAYPAPTPPKSAFLKPRLYVRCLPLRKPRRTQNTVIRPCNLLPRQRNDEDVWRRARGWLRALLRSSSDPCCRCEGKRGFRMVAGIEPGVMLLALYKGRIARTGSSALAQTRS